MCGCRATDLVRYTRINKSFGCQTTKAVRMGRSASEQIARNRANVDCIKPMHRTIFINIKDRITKQGFIFSKTNSKSFFTALIHEVTSGVK